MTLHSAFAIAVKLMTEKIVIKMSFKFKSCVIFILNLTGASPTSLLQLKFIDFINKRQITLREYEPFYMILVCPSCTARYLIPSKSLGGEGREVRCAKCDHEWFQGPDEFGPTDNFESVSQPSHEQTDAVLDDDGDISSDDLPNNEASYEEPERVDDVELSEVNEPSEVDAYLEETDIPESVKPDGKTNVPAFAKDVLRQKPSLQARLAGYMGALAVFGLLIIGAFFFKTTIIEKWPPATVIYELAGSSTSLKGEELVVESLSAQVLKDVDGRNYLLLQGRVVNLTNEIQSVPPLLARLRSTNGDDGDSWTIDTPLETLEPGEAFTFKSDYPAVPKGVGSVNLTFLPVVKI